MNNKTGHPCMPVSELALLGLILQHIVGKSYIRHGPLSADWLAGNFIDSLFRPSLILLLTAVGVMAKEEYRKGIDSFYRKMSAILPFLIALIVYIAVYGRYDTRPFEFRTAGILQTFGHTLYWVPLLITYWVVTPALIWVGSQRNGQRALLAFMCCWAVFAVIIPSVYSYRFLLPAISAGGTEFEQVLGFCKRVLDIVNDSMAFKLSGFFLIGLFYADSWRETIERNAALKVLTDNFVLLALYAMTLYVPFAEHLNKMNPFDHSLRDYIILHQALLGIAVYLKLASSPVTGALSEWRARHGNLCDCSVAGMYVIHGALIEMFAGWIPPVPVLGMFFKTSVLLFSAALFGGALYLILRVWRAGNLRYD